MTLYAICFVLSLYFVYDSYENDLYYFSIGFIAVALLCLYKMIVLL